MIIRQLNKSVASAKEKRRQPFHLIESGSLELSNMGHSFGRLYKDKNAKNRNMEAITTNSDLNKHFLNQCGGLACKVASLPTFWSQSMSLQLMFAVRRRLRLLN